MYGDLVYRAGFIVTQHTISHGAIEAACAVGANILFDRCVIGQHVKERYLSQPLDVDLPGIHDIFNVLQVGSFVAKSAPTMI